MRGRKVRIGRPASLAVAVTTLVLLIVLLASGTALAAPPWSDAPNSWWMATYQLTDQEVGTVADGYPDGTFRPGLDVTRGQFAKMVVDGMDVPTAPWAGTFRDVPATNLFVPWIEGGAAAGIISGFADGTFGPNRTIIRQQANSILGSYLAQRELNLRGHIAGAQQNYPSLNTWYLAEGLAILATFADSSRVATVHAPATAYLILRQVVQGSPSGGLMYLGPNNNLTRAQAAALIMRVKTIQFSTALPTVTLLDPNSGPAAGGTNVTITGTNFTDVTSVMFGGKKAGFVVNSSTRITATAPSGTLGSTVDVVVTTAAGSSATAGTANDYTYGVPTLTGLNPAGGPAAGGNSVVISGTNLTGVINVRFGTKLATAVIQTSSTQITVTAPSGTAGTTVDVTVTTGGGTTATSAASKYSYGPPTVTALNPASGAAVGGTSVTITGTGFTGVTAVRFGTKAATSYTVNSPTSITAIAPSGVAGTTVDVTVTTAAGTSATSSASKYSYGGPVVSALSPSVGPIAGGNTVIVTGTGFTGVTAVWFGTKAATTYTVNSTTQITAVAPSGTGTVQVTVTTAAGSSATGSASAYTYGAPTITSLDPSAGPAAGGNQVIINGNGFVNVTAVRFGATNALSYTVLSPTQVRAFAPPGTNGATVQVTVTASGLTSSTDGTGNDYTYGVAKFAIVMSGTGLPLSATPKQAGTPFWVTVIAQDSAGATITGFTGTVVLTSNAWVGPVNAVIASAGSKTLQLTPTIAGAPLSRSIAATWESVVTSNASGFFTVTPGPAARLQVLLPGETAAPGTTTGKTGTPNNQASGVAFTATVRSVDANWNLVSTTETVQLTASGGSMTPVANKPLAAGSTTFSVTFNATGSWTLTATDVSAGPPHLTAGTSSAVPVTGPFTKLLVLLPGETHDPTDAVDGKSGTPSARTAGVAFNITVIACDANWAQVSSTDTIAITTTDPADTHPANKALVAGATTFSITLKTAPGPWTVTATDVTNGAITPGVSSPVTVNPGALNNFTFAAISSPQQAGVDFGITLTAYDAFGNVKTDYAGGAGLALTASNGGTVTPAAPLNAGWASGVWANNVKVTNAGATVHLTATHGSATGNSGSFQVVAGAVVGQIVYQHSITGAAGTWVTTALDVEVIPQDYRYLRIQLLDLYGNPMAGLNLAAVQALDILMLTANDGGTGDVLDVVAALPDSNNGTDANGFLNSGEFQYPSNGASFNDSYVWADLGDPTQWDSGEVKSLTLRTVFSTP